MCKRRIGYQRYECAFKLPEIAAYPCRKEYQDIVAELDAFPEAPCLEHCKPRREIRLLKFYGKSPLEPGEHPLLEVLEFYWRSVRSEYQLLASLVKMVEYMEKRILRPRGGKLLNVVNDKDIHLHVECEKIGEPVLYHCLHELCLEPVGRHIQHYKFRKFFLNLYAYRLGDMGLAESWTSEQEKRIERRLPRSHGYALPCSDTHLVAFALDKIGKTVYGIELRVDLHSLRARIYEWTRIGCRRICGDGYRLVDRRKPVRSRISHWRLYRHRSYHIVQLGCGPYLSLEHFLYDIEE